MDQDKDKDAQAQADPVAALVAWQAAQAAAVGGRPLDAARAARVAARAWAIAQEVGRRRPDVGPDGMEAAGRIAAACLYLRSELDDGKLAEAIAEAWAVGDTATATAVTAAMAAKLGLLLQPRPQPDDDGPDQYREDVAGEVASLIREEEERLADLQELAQASRIAGVLYEQRPGLEPAMAARAIVTAWDGSSLSDAWLMAIVLDDIVPPDPGNEGEVVGAVLVGPKAKDDDDQA